MFEALLGVNPWTSLFILLNTLTIFFVARKYLFGPVMNMISARQQEIDTCYADADSAIQEADSLRTAYQKKLSDVQAASQQILKDAALRGQAREEEILRQAKAEAAAIRDKAAADIEQEKKNALNDAKSEISGLAIIIASQVLGRQLSTADQSSLIENFIRDMGNDL